MAFYFENNIFNELIKKYPAWNELRNYLESDEGGLFRIVDTNDKGFCLIRYEKGISNMELPHSKWFRSVVWDTVKNLPLCVAPPKTTSEIFPYNTIKEVLDAGVVCQELLEGFMINCFRVCDDNTLYITSRSKLNATGTFYSDKSFRDLFIESYTNTNDTPNCIDTTFQDNLVHIQPPNALNNEIAVFYSFLVQHKEHRIVKNIQNNRVYVIHSGIVYSDGRVLFNDSPPTFKGQLNIENITLEQKPITGSYAQIISTTTNEVLRWTKDVLIEKDWQFQGLVFKDMSGNRWRFRSDKYSAIKSLRGNSSAIRDRFAQLYTQNLLNKYLEYYPYEIVQFSSYIALMGNIVKLLYNNYVDLHITKNKKVADIDKMFLPHLYNIHGLYLTNLHPNGKKVNLTEIILYLHKQPWQRIAFLIKKTG